MIRYPELETFKREQQQAPGCCWLCDEPPAPRAQSGRRPELCGSEDCARVYQRLYSAARRAALRAAEGEVSHA